MREALRRVGETIRSPGARPNLHRSFMGAEERSGQLIVSAMCLLAASLMGCDPQLDTSAGGLSSGDKVTICHVPPGNEGNPITLTIGAAAAQAHLEQHEHDYLGECRPPDGGSPTPDAGPGADSGGSDASDGGQPQPPDSGPPPCEPEPETCNNEDDDCDGAIDEELSRPCSGACGSGTEVCWAGGWGDCDAPGPVCAPGGQQACPYSGPAGTEGVGLCRAGSQTCNADGCGFSQCSGEVLPSAEECDGGTDEDCDGAIDEDCVCTEGDTQPCGSDEGVCKRGTHTCSSGSWGPCEGEIPAVPETCDGLDNDCDGSTDEGVCHRLYSTLLVRNHSAGTNRQFTEVLVANPNDTAVKFWPRIFREDGSLLYTFLKEVPAQGLWNSYSDPDWLAMPYSTAADRSSLGWIEVLSTQPVAASTYHTIRDGTEYNSPLVNYDQEALVAKGPTALHATLLVRNHSAGTNRQFTDLRIANPNDSAASATVKVFKQDGGLLYTFVKEVPAHGVWGSYGDPTWLAMPFTDAATRSTVGWIEVSSTQALVASTYHTIRSGTDYYSPLVNYDQEMLVAKGPALLQAALLVRNHSAGEHNRQFTELRVANPNNAAASATVRAYRKDGSLLHTFVKSVPAHGVWTSYGDPAWLAMPYSNPADSSILGRLEVSSTLPVVAITYHTIRSGTDYYSPLVNYEIEGLSSQ